MAVTELGAAVIGALLVAGTWLSVLLTVFTLSEQASLLSRVLTRAMGVALLSLARRLPETVQQPVLGYGMPLMFFATVAVWLGANSLGFALLIRAAYGVPVHAAAAAAFALAAPRLRASEAPLVAVAWLSTLLILASFVVYLMRALSAYSRRELMISRLSAEATRTLDAETVLGEYLAGGSQHHLAAMFGDWTSWFADVQATHLSCPALIYSRSPSRCWSGSAQIILDCAALTKACAPSWAPPQASSLLAVGTRCLPRVAARLGIELPAVPVSYQGREARPFSATLSTLAAAGLPLDVDNDRAQATFQRLRVGYAPFANAICERLLLGCEDL